MIHEFPFPLYVFVFISQSKKMLLKCFDFWANLILPQTWKFEMQTPKLHPERYPAWYAEFYTVKPTFIQGIHNTQNLIYTQNK